MSFLLVLLKERQSKRRRLRPAPAGQCHVRRPAGEVPPLLTPPLQARLLTASVIQPLLYLALRDPPRHQTLPWRKLLLRQLPCPTAVLEDGALFLALLEGCWLRWWAMFGRRRLGG